MKIDVVTTKQDVPFKDLADGDTFWRNAANQGSDDTIGMKMDCVSDGRNRYNSVDLDDGLLRYVGDDELVIPVRVKVVADA